MLSPLQLEILQSQPQQTSLYISIFEPKTVMACQPTGSMPRNSMVIPYHNVSTGTYSNIESGMTLLAGTTEGGAEAGRIRIRTADASKIYVSENSNIDWPNANYLTVIRFFELWPVYPRIVNDPNNPENVIFYKDYDISYANQNRQLGVIPNAGPHRAGFLENGTHQEYWSASGTYNPLGSSLSYFWEFEGGTPSASNVETPGYVSYDTPGHYTTKLTISGSNGTSDVTYRTVSVYDRPEDGEHTIPMRCYITEMNGSRGEGGYTVSFRLYNPIGKITDGARVVIFADDWYGEQKVSLGGNAENCSSIVFVGYILKSSIRWNYADSYVDFSVGSIAELMKKSMGFAIDVESKTSPSTWYELYNMDCRRAVQHYLKWHSTLFMMTDYQFLGPDYQIQFFDSDRESMFDAVDNFLRNTILGELVCDRQGKLWAETQAWCAPNATGTYTPVMNLTRRNWINEPLLYEHIQPETSYVELGGIAYSGPATGTSSALLSCAPGEAPGFRGTIDKREGLALTGQEQLNQLSGNLYANQIARFREIEIEMAGNYRNLDIAPQMAVSFDMKKEDTIYGLELHALYRVDGMSWTYDAAQQSFHPNSVSLTQITSGMPGQTISIPPIPDDGGYGGPGKFKFPKLPPFSPISPLITPIMKRYDTDYSITDGDDDLPAKLKYLDFVYPYAAGISGSVPAGAFSWPSVLYTDSPEAAIDINQGGIYRVTINVSCYGGEYNNGHLLIGFFGTAFGVGTTQLPINVEVYSDGFGTPKIISQSEVCYFNAGTYFGARASYQSDTPGGALLAEISISIEMLAPL